MYDNNNSALMGTPHRSLEKQFVFQTKAVYLHKCVLVRGTGNRNRP